jgi:non-ribosomal peptide synthetase component F
LVLRAETSATSAVVTLSVAVAVAGHVLVSGGSVPLAVVPQLLALAGACWLLGEFLSEELAVIALAAVQLVVHFTLNSVHQAQLHDMSMPMATEPMHMTVGGTLAMSVAHLVALLAGIGVIGHAHGWATRVLRILARLVPELPSTGLIVVPVIRRVLTVVPEPQLTQRWLNSNGSRRGPPYGPVSLALS